MTRINYAGKVWVRITRDEWAWAGGEVNPELLKLENKYRDPDNSRKSYNYFKLRGDK